MAPLGLTRQQIPGAISLTVLDVQLVRKRNAFRRGQVGRWAMLVYALELDPNVR